MSTKRRAEHLRVRQRQPLGRVARVAQQEHVDVDRARPVADVALTRLRAAHLALDRLAGVEQRLGLELGVDPQAGVEEARLVEDLADRVGVVRARRCAGP